MKKCITLIFGVFAITSGVLAQNFDPVTFAKQEAEIDSLAAYEDGERYIKAIEKQLEYLKKSERQDSLYKYVYTAGRAYASYRDPIAAVKIAEDLVRITEKHSADTSHILLAYNDLTWVYYELGLDSLCFVIDSKNLELCEKYTNASPKEISDAHYSLGFDHQIRGNGKKAVYHFRKALEPIAEDTAQYLQRRIDSHNALGAALWRNGQMSLAQKELKKSLELSALIKDTTTQYLYQANALGNLSLIAEDQGNLVLSKELLESSMNKRTRAMAHMEPGYQFDSQQRNLISNYHNLSALYLTLGDISRAQSMQEYVRDLRLKSLPVNHADHSKSDEAFGSIALAQGAWETALSYFSRSLESCYRNFGRDSYYTAVAHQRLAEVNIELGNFKKALEHLTEEIEIGKLISTDYSGQELARAYQLRAKVYEMDGAPIEAANDLLRSVRIYGATRGKESPAVAQNFLQLSSLHLNENRIDSAKYYANAALNILLGKRKEQTQAYDGKYSGLMRHLPDVYLQQARLALEGKTNKEARLKALEYLEAAMKYLRDERINFEGDAAQLLLFDSNTEVYNLALAIAYDLYKETGEERYENLTLRYAEENKSVLLRRQLNHFTSLRVSNVPDSIISKERVLLAKMSSPETDVAEYPALEKEYDALISMMAKDYPKYFSLRYSDRGISIPEIQKEILSEGQTLIEYAFAGNRLFAIVISELNSTVIEVSAVELEEEIEAFNRSILSRNLHELQEAGYGIYKKLIQPLENHLAGTELLIIPDGALYSVNFEALPVFTGSKKWEYLIQQYTISYLLSASSTLLYSKLEKEPEETVLAIAPGFSDEVKRNFLGGADSIGEARMYSRLIRQPFAMDVASHTAGIFSGRALIASEATEDEFKKNASRYKIIHLGTHTEINNTAPLLSRLILTRNGQSDENDGLLHAYEIYNIPLRAELAVLTACETGVGKRSSSEGVLSMAHGFAYAGCPSLVMSLWKIDEKTSSEIITSFYDYLADGMPKNEAIRQAKLDYLASAENELLHPYYWSGMVLFGNVEPIKTGTSWTVFAAVALLALGIVVFVVLIRRRKKLKV